MSITNKDTNKYEIITGSGNWTRKNIGLAGQASPNLEANLVVKGDSKVVRKFNSFFDRFWSNEGKTKGQNQNRIRRYSVDYKDHPLNNNPDLPKNTDEAREDGDSWGAKEKDNWKAYMKKWEYGEDTGLVSW